MYDFKVGWGEPPVGINANRRRVLMIPYSRVDWLFRHLQQWFVSVRALKASSELTASHVESLLYDLDDENSGFVASSIQAPKIVSHNGMNLIEFGTPLRKAPGEVKRRAFQLIDFAVMRLIELYPYMVMRVEETSKELFHFKLSIPEIKYSPRLLLLLFRFNDSGELREIRGTDHHLIIRENFSVVKRRRAKPPMDQADLVRAIGAAISQTPYPRPLPFTSSEFCSLLASLLDLAHEWHGNELVGSNEPS